MNKLSSNKLRYLFLFYKRLSERSFLLDIASALGRHPILSLPINASSNNALLEFELDKPPVEGDLICYSPKTEKQSENIFVGYVSKVNPNQSAEVTYLCPFAEVKNRPLINVTDVFEMEKNFMHNSTKITTSFGRFFYNYMVWYHNGVDIPFDNETQNPSDIEKTIVKLLLDKKIEPVIAKKIIQCIYFVASYTALFVPTLSEKSMMTSPEVKKRKKELLKEYGEKLTDPLVAKQFEQELISMDQTWLEGDVSRRFLDPLPSKTWDLHRKKMFIGIGGIPSFDAGSNKYTFIPNSLSEGWTVESFPDICNEIRKGAFDRGKETAKGGEQTKFLLRIFQDVRITEDDCHTHEGLSVIFDETSVEDYYGQYISMGNESILLTKETAKRFFNKPVTMRSPMSCKTVNGRCKVCSGNIFDTLDMKAIGMTVLKVGSRFTTLSMKNMHGTVISSIKIDPFDYFITPTK